MAPSTLQAERHVLEDILTDSLDCLLAVTFGETCPKLH